VSGPEPFDGSRSKPAAVVWLEVRKVIALPFSVTRLTPLKSPVALRPRLTTGLPFGMLTLLVASFVSEGKVDHPCRRRAIVPAQMWDGRGRVGDPEAC